MSEEWLQPYDAGLLNDYGGGKVEWWWNYIRDLLSAAYDFHSQQYDELVRTKDEQIERRMESAAECGRLREKIAQLSAPPAAEPEIRIGASGEESPVFSRSDIRKMYKNVERRFSQREPFFDAWREPLRVVFEIVLGLMDPSATDAKWTVYPHLAYCNGDRRFPAGEPGHLCCCLNTSQELSELCAAIDEVGRMPHQFHCSVRVTPATVNSLVSEDPEENPNNTIPVLPSCTCYKSQRLAILRARLAELEKKVEEKP